MVAAQSPYEDGDERFTIEQIVDGRFVWSNIDDETMEFIKKMVALRPDGRPSASDILNDHYFDDVEEAEMLPGPAQAMAAKDYFDSVFA